MLKLVDLLKEITLLEYNKSQLDYIAVKLNIEDRNEFNSLMNALDAQSIKYSDLKKQIEDGSLKTIEDLLDKFRKNIKEWNGAQNEPESGFAGSLSGSDNKEPMENPKDKIGQTYTTIRKRKIGVKK